MAPYTSGYHYHLPSVRTSKAPEEMAPEIDMNFLYMLFQLHLTQLITTEISFIVGLMVHVYIIAVNVIDWRKGGSMSTSDQVIFSIMISRMIFQAVMQLNLIWEFFWVMSSPIYFTVFRIIYFSTMYASFWLSTLLCVVFYLKISNIRRVFLLWMRRIISKKILHFIMASLLVSVGQTSVLYTVHYTTISYIFLHNITYVLMPAQQMSTVYFVNMFGPVILFILASLFLIISLYLHIRNIRDNGTMTSSLDVYYKIIKYTAGTLVTTVLCVIISVLSEIYYYIFAFVSFSCPWTFFGTLHSMLLIYATPKLRNPISRIFKYLSNCWTKREEPRDLVMTVTT